MARVSGGLFTAISFDADGQLWGITKGSAVQDSQLFKIDKTNGETTLVGDLGYKQKNDYSSSVFDYRTGKLYWAAITFTVNQYWEESYQAYLMEVDLDTGHATPVKAFLNEELFTSLFIKDSHPKAPEGAGALTFAYNSGSDNAGKVTFDVPARRYDRSQLSGAVKAEIYLDGTLSQTLTSLTPGSQAASQVMNLTDGSHKIRVFLYDSEGRKSVAADAIGWGGRDVPEKVGNIRLEVSPHGESATITWDAPTAGKNGGNFDARQMTYRIVRRPEMQTIATGLTTTTFTDTPDRPMRLSQYDVYADTPSGSSDVSHSKPALIGAAYPMTYLETFDSAEGFNTYTTIDVNGVGSAEGDRWMWHPTFGNAIYWINYNARNTADAWLITPTLALEPDNVYRLSFTTVGYASMPATYSLTAAVGELPTAESLDREVFAIRGGKTSKEPLNSHALFLAEEGDCRVGFHLINDGNDHCGLDNVRVALYGPSTIPAAPTNVTAENGGSKANIRLTLPTVDTRGRDSGVISKVSLYRDGTSAPVATLSKPTGKSVVISDPNPVFGINNYTVTCSNASGEGLEANVSLDMRAAKPVSVESVSLRSIADGTDVEVSWEYPAGYPAEDGSRLDPAAITYDIYRIVDGNRTDVAKSVSGTSYTDRGVGALCPDNSQKRISYAVVAVTSGGSAAETTGDILIGRAFDLPIEVSDFYNLPVKPWVSAPASAWGPCETGYEPRATPYSPYTMMRCMASGSSAQTWTSPRINLAGLAAPTLKYQFYHDNSSKAQGVYLEIGIVRDIDGVEQEMVIVPGSRTDCYAAESGWNEITLDLSAYADCPRASVVFVGHASSGHMIYIDDILISGTKLERDLRVDALDGPANAVRGRDNIFTATVTNVGTSRIENAPAALSADGNIVGTSTVSLDPDESIQIEFTYRPELNGDDVNVRLQAEVSADGDGNANNNSAVRTVEVISPNVPYVNDLAASYSPEENQVRLTWGEAVTYPRAFPVKEDFESYDNFIIDGIGDWTLIDRDEATTIQGISSSMGTFTWPNCGIPQAYIVFNPINAGVSGLCEAYSGNKCLVAFCAAEPNDDWLISPRLLGAEQEISFFARAMNEYYTNETFEIWTSSTGTDIEDFELFEEGRTRSAAWQQFSYVLPGGTRYFAIRCTSDNQFGLMLDDITYIPAQPDVDLMGYNVYRDGTAIANAIGETEYTDANVVPDSEYVYRVSAIYEDGESIYSNAADVRTTGVSDVTAAGVRIFSAARTLRITGAAGMPVTVAAPDGRLLYRIVSSGDDALPVAPGIYLVSAAGKSVKLMIK